jgi:glycine amidinotransferase
MPIVNSHNEWSPLKEVILGAGFPESLPSDDFSFKLFFHDNLYGTSFYKKEEQSYITKQLIAEHNEDLENYSALLTSLGVNVLRPKVPKNIMKTKTLTFESTNFPSLNPRDLTMIVGNEIIESSPICRFRYFENDYLKHIFHDYFKNGSKWTVAPKPLLLDSSFDIDYVCRKNNDSRDYYEKEQKKDDHYLKIGHEIMFDAACCMRLGKHIIFNVSNKNAELGYVWLQRHLPNYTICPVNITDWHIDSSFVPLRPGLAIVADSHTPKKLPAMMKNWDYIVAPDYITSRERRTAKLASPLIDINVLSINENAIIANSANATSYHLRKALEKYKVEVIDCPIRHSEIFAGAHHCLTLDTIREGTLENYFN